MGKDFGSRERGFARVSRRNWLLSTLGLWIPASVFPQAKTENVAKQIEGGSAAGERVGMDKEAAPADDAQMVMLEGADAGPLMPGLPPFPFTSVIPISKCMTPETLVAFRLNGQFLPPRNGFPARALVPGWYAMDSVKWLRRIIVLGPGDRASDFEASGMSQIYNRVVKPAGGEPKIERLTGMLVKSAIAWPADNTKLPAGRHLIRGFAWTGAGLIRGVEFSSDGGNGWIPAKLESRPKTFSWVKWSYAWPAASGDYVLMS